MLILVCPQWYTNIGWVVEEFHRVLLLLFVLSLCLIFKVLEGLAYLHHSFRPPIYTGAKPDVSLLGRGSEDVLDVLDKLRADRPLTEHMLRRGNEIRRVSDAKDGGKKKTLPILETWVCRDELGDPKNTFQTKVMALLEKGDLFADLVLSIKVPPQLKSVKEIASWVLDQAIIVYQVC